MRFGSLFLGFLCGCLAAALGLWLARQIHLLQALLHPLVRSLHVLLGAARLHRHRSPELGALRLPYGVRAAVHLWQAVLEAEAPRAARTVEVHERRLGGAARKVARCVQLADGLQ